MIDFAGDPLAFLQRLVLQVPALLLAVTVHEVAHGIVADRLGDPTARRLGRLTLNPLPHLDLLGALAFVVAGFGWAKPVPVNADNLPHPRRDMALVAAAGPLSNFALAFVALLVFGLVSPHLATPFFANPILGVLRYVYLFNLGLAVFNLIPLPPLDGGHFLPYVLGRGPFALLHRLEQYGPLILILLVVSGATRYVMEPLLVAVNALFVGLVRLIA